MYSAPSIVMQTRGPDGSLHIFDDFREGYAWLRSNTAEDAIIASWCALLYRGSSGFWRVQASMHVYWPGQCVSPSCPLPPFQLRTVPKQ